MNLQDHILTVLDWPETGIQFRDITPLLANPEAVEFCMGQFESQFPSESFDKIVMPEARGFLLGAPLAARMQKGMILARKSGKLPRKHVSATYQKEYGPDQIHLHEDSIEPGERVILVDDVLAFGSTAAAVGELVGQLGGRLVGYAFLIELLDLRGRDKLGSVTIQSLVQY